MISCCAKRIRNPLSKRDKKEPQHEKDKNIFQIKIRYIFTFWGGIHFAILVKAIKTVLGESIFEKPTGRWVAQIRIDGKARRLESFASPEIAAKAASEARQKYMPFLLNKSQGYYPDKQFFAERGKS